MTETGNSSTPQPSNDVAFSCRDLSMSYGATLALDSVDLDIRRGTVHALLGANGAGKSTLIKIVAGLQPPTRGEVTLEGRRYAPSSAGEALQAGVRVAHQELAVVPGLTVAQNLGLGKRFRPEFDESLYRELFAEWGIDVDMRARLHSLSPAMQATVSLARSLVSGANLILLDEPTASLGPHEVDGLFRIVRRRASEGAAIVFVSHRLGEVSRICDRASVLRNGALVSEGEVAGWSENQLAELIAPTIEQPQQRRLVPEVAAALAPGEAKQVPVLHIKDVALHSRVRRASLQVARGEILGVAGLVGAGRTELLEALMGLRPLESGSIELLGESFKPRSARDAISRGVALVPEERGTQALFPQRSIVFNCSSSRFRELGRGPKGWLSSPPRYLLSTRELMDALALKAASLKDPITTLSGGNQQKVVLGRVLTPGLKLLLLDEPTRGVDVGARRDFQTLIRTVAAQGVAVVYVSSELAELDFCDRIQVMVEGRTTEEAPSGAEFDEDALTRLCFATDTTGAVA
ncbi:sugar ABC transporter ATP-binding protein [Aeromicrobium sp. CF4.19]|uniref:sugar ABC transporter ATP-binding protein n=1 Tax=Aeromicrobium sp. CF4.19 TaxID=3373082 RepID=UPI003EE63777